MLPLISAIYAVSENAVIGRDNDLPWHLPNDLKFFKTHTLGKPMIMGRKTYESIGKPLPRRRNLVLSRQADFRAEGIEMFPSLEKAIDACAGAEEIVLIGGAGLYKEAFAHRLVGKVYQTLVHADVPGDTYFSLPQPEEWTLISEEPHPADERHAHAYTFRVLERRPS